MIFAENKKQSIPYDSAKKTILSLSSPLIFVVIILSIITKSAQLLNFSEEFITSANAVCNQLTKLIFPLVSAKTAYSLSGFDAMAVGTLGGFIAGSGATLLSLSGDAHGISGIYGALIAGYGASHITKLTKHIFNDNKDANYCNNIFSTSLSLLLTFLLMLSVNQISYILNCFCILILTAVSNIHPVLLSVIIGIFIASDCMGPFFIGSSIFASATLVTGSSDSLTCISSAAMVPALSLGVFCILYHKRFSQAEKLWGVTALVGGIFGTNIASVPFYTSKPVKTILCCLPGGCTASVLCTLFRCTTIAEKPLFFLLSVICGVLVSVYAMSIVFVSSKVTEEHQSEGAQAVANTTA